MGRKEDDGPVELKAGGIVVVNPKPQGSMISSAIDWLEWMIVKIMHDSSKPLPYLSGNFAPAPEETAPCKDLPVIGQLPECLNGEFVRLGPNPNFTPVAGYHWFDGDGCVDFSDFTSKHILICIT
ncbi:unnamed protein product [Cuscuta epithymum]|uniref:Uncharacterized protein n=1 Tax=Cuscuta epithymum TaxID=186058 RepID=A0AAV0E6A4_9ASTE|nr:unnamed protein product [Cuscuta epithymum]